jgi:hypothetical protein
VSRSDGGAAWPFFLSALGPIDSLLRSGPFPHGMGKKADGPPINLPAASIVKFAVTEYSAGMFYASHFAACGVVLMIGFSPLLGVSFGEEFPLIMKICMAALGWGLALRIASTAKYSETARPVARVIGLGSWILVLMPAAVVFNLASDSPTGMHQPDALWRVVLESPVLLSWAALMYAMISVQFMIFRKNLAVQFFGRHVPTD